MYLIISWLGTIILTVSVFAFEYWAIYRISPLNFTPLSALNFWSFLGYSFGKIAPTSISLIQPASVVAAVITYIEIFCAIVIMVILAFSVLTAARERYKEDIASFIDEMHQLNEVAQNEFLRIYELALADVEIFLHRENAAVVNWVRKTKGLSELTLPTVEKENQP